jgi:hypothetical protein
MYFGLGDFMCGCWQVAIYIGLMLGIYEPIHTNLTHLFVKLQSYNIT